MALAVGESNRLKDGMDTPANKESPRPGDLGQGLPFAPKAPLPYHAMPRHNLPRCETMSLAGLVAGYKTRLDSDGHETGAGKNAEGMGKK